MGELILNQDLSLCGGKRRQMLVGWLFCRMATILICRRGAVGEQEKGGSCGLAQESFKYLSTQD